jgi:hypothetical protein
MVPISHQDWFESFVRIVVSSRWTVSDQRPKHPISILQRVVAVVPTTAILHGSEFISEAITRNNGTLRDAIDTIHMRSVQSSDTMEMDRCAAERELISNLYL